MRELSYIVHRRIKDPRLEGVTITGVKVSIDYRYADIYVYRLGGDPSSLNEAMEGIESASGFIRHELAGLLTIRQAPELRFHLDQSITYGERIDSLLDQIAQERQTDGDDTNETSGAADC
ncbi:MAG: 30S ribosome-binding factor RbfA [Anaerolineae bacterium]|nr:30S ribosome-binding factor RbfA [Anaerolineae bacterium]